VSSGGRLDDKTDFNRISQKLKKESILTEVWEIQTTLGNAEDAARIARRLVELGLAACVQIQEGIRSLYRWQGAIHFEPEQKLIVKTSTVAFEYCVKAIRREHPYEVPEITARTIPWVSDSYAAWVIEQTKPSRFHIRIGWHESNAAPTFEAVFESLSSIASVHVEPDGSFVRRSWDREQNNLSWQVDGMLYDRNNRLQHVELKGCCDRSHWMELCQALLIENISAIKYQSVDNGEWLEGSDFLDRLW
jgi:periplasmic divalent cation tolerance protein